METKNTMTLHRALAELKLIDSKIAKTLDNLIPIGIRQKGKKIYGAVDEKEFNEVVKSDYASVSSLIDRKNKIKCAIVLKNAITSVVIAGKTYTIAEAINFKALLQYKKNLLSRLELGRKKAYSELEKNQAAVDANMQKSIETLLGKDSVKSDQAEVENIRKLYTDNHSWEIVDPLKIDEEIKKLQNEIEEFSSEVDAVLSEANAINSIEI